MLVASTNRCQQSVVDQLVRGAEYSSVPEDFTLGPRFRAYRHRHGIQQKVVSTALGHTSNTYVSRLELGQVPLSDAVAKRWAAALGVSIEEIRATAPLTADEAGTPRQYMGRRHPTPIRSAAPPPDLREFLDLLAASLVLVEPDQRKEATLKGRAAIESCWGGRATEAKEPERVLGKPDRNKKAHTGR